MIYTWVFTMKTRKSEVSRDSVDGVPSWNGTKWPLLAYFSPLDDRNFLPKNVSFEVKADIS